MNIIVFGASGTVGSRVTNELSNRGSLVQAASLTKLGQERGVLSFTNAVKLIGENHFDLVINASGPRPGSSGMDVKSIQLEKLVTAILDARVKGILISTIRVKDGGSNPFIEGTPPQPVTDYARINALYEEIWLKSESHMLSVCRAVNLLLVPLKYETSQLSLLPWSLVEQALQNRDIDIQTPLLTKEFISIPDLVSALILISEHEDCPRIVETRPGRTFTISEIATDVASILKTQIGGLTLASPSIQINPNSTEHSTWLVKNGWISSLSRSSMREYINQYLLPLEL